MADKYRSKIACSMHRTMSGIHDIWLVDKKTMRDFDSICLTKAEAL